MKNYLKWSFCFLTFLFFVSCKKNLTNNNDTNPYEVVLDLQAKVNASVSGFVTDQDDAPVVNAEVKAGTSITSTDRYGYFELRNIEVVKQAAVVTVTKTGYFKNVKTWVASEGKSSFSRIKLLVKSIVGNVNTVSGGTVSLANGLTVAFPANAFKNTSTGNGFTGIVNVYAQYIDPTSSELYKIMPGDLRGINSQGNVKMLTSYGMLALELKGQGGESLQIADGMKSTITMPIPASMAADAPLSIPLWYFDEVNGLWKEEGYSTKINNKYVGEVNHFSSWNIDIPNATALVDFTLTDSAGRSISNVNFDISPVLSYSVGHVAGYTDETGYVKVPVTANTEYKLKVLSGGSIAFYRTFRVENTDVSLGNIIASGNNAAIKGTVSDCNNSPLLNGRVILNDGYQYWNSNVNNGQFEFSVLIPTASADIGVLAEDFNNSQQGQAKAFTIVNGINMLGNIQACGINTDTYLNYTINGRTFICGNSNSSSGQIQQIGTDSFRTVLYWTVVETHNGVPIPNSFSNIYINFWSFGPLSNHSTLHYAGPTAVYIPNLLNFSLHINPLLYITNNLKYDEIPLYITEYGSIGEFIAGSYSGRFYEDVLNTPDMTRPYDVNCSFRIRRTQ